MSVPDSIDRRTLVTALALVALLAGMLVAAAGNAPRTDGYLYVERANETPSDVDPTPFAELDPGQKEQFKRALGANDPVRIGTDERGFEFYESTYVEYRDDTYRVLVAAP